MTDESQAIRRTKRKHNTRTAAAAQFVNVEGSMIENSQARPRTKRKYNTAKSDTAAAAQSVNVESSGLKIRIPGLKRRREKE
jgi:hypothetical protein